MAREWLRMLKGMMTEWKRLMYVKSWEAVPNKNGSPKEELRTMKVDESASPAMHRPPWPLG